MTGGRIPVRRARAAPADRLPDRRHRRVEFVIGVDPHPQTHTASALDRNGEVSGTIEVENTEEGLEVLGEWAERFPERRWAIEGATNPFVAPWVAKLLADGEEVTNVAPSLTSQYRSRRGAKKNDAVDAQNVARALLANPRLPAHLPHPGQRRLQVLSRTRARLSRQLKANRMAMAELPEDSEERAILEGVAGFLAEKVKRLGEMLAEAVAEVMPEVMEIRGVGPVLGATILAEVGDVGRFADADCFVSYCGGPVERSSGKSARVRVNPGGNRTMNWVVHMIAQVRLRTDGGRSRALVERKVREGKTLRAALRVLKTYVARELYRTLEAIRGRREGGLAVT